MLTQDTQEVALPFSFQYFGRSYDRVYISRFGFVSFEPLTAAYNTPTAALPSDDAPPNAIFAFWTNLDYTTNGRTQYLAVGALQADLYVNCDCLHRVL